jgi:hypothetical protein
VPLERELATFQAHLSEWSRAHSGKFALVVGEELIGVFDTPEKAYEAGILRFGNIPMLIRQLRPDDETAFLPALTLGLIYADPAH